MSNSRKVRLHLFHNGSNYAQWAIQLTHARMIFGELEIGLEVASLVSLASVEELCDDLESLKLPKLGVKRDPGAYVKSISHFFGRADGIAVIFTGGSIKYDGTGAAAYSTNYMSRPLCFVGNSKYGTVWTLSHELGHILGDNWNHDDDPSLIMSPTYKLGTHPHFTHDQILTLYQSELIVPI